jgi:hypothetical protein
MREVGFACDYIETWKLVGVEKRGRQGRERQERESLRVYFVS